MIFQKIVSVLENLKGLRLFAFVALVSFGVIAVGAMKTGYKEPVADALGYADRAIAFSVIPEQKETEQHNVIVFAPLYPAVLSSLAMLDTRLDETLECYHNRVGGCDVNGLALVYWFQILLGALSAVVLFYTAENITGNRLVSLTTFVFVLIFGKFHDYAVWLITESFYYFLFFCFAYFSSCFLFSENRKRFVFFAAFFLSLAALARPPYLYLYYALVLALPVYLLLARKLPLQKILAVSLTFLVPFCVLVLPWMLRNLEYYGVFGVSAGYASFILSERVTYNLMTWQEFLVSWIYWLPDFGDSLAASLFAPEYWQRLDFGYPEGFYLIGNTETRSTIYSLASTDPERVRILVSQYILAEPFKHVMVTLALAWRGMLVVKYFSLFGVVALFPALKRLGKRQEGDKLLAFAFSFFFMLGFNAFVSVNVARYNVPLIFIYSLAVAVVLAALVSFFQQKLRR
ncbi:hypothetical protein [Kiloniella sp. b19]|uniref:hypothetical protein n=1 Tax=Kiloniella sp. GXU_MW_B19 TaxID=3141326 RepID=UPI0031DB3398